MFKMLAEARREALLGAVGGGLLGAAALGFPTLVKPWLRLPWPVFTFIVISLAVLGAVFGVMTHYSPDDRR